MDAMDKLREGLQNALTRAQHVTQQGIKHQFAELGSEIVKLGREMEKLGGIKHRKMVRKVAPKKPVVPVVHS